MNHSDQSFGRTIQLFLVDGTANGLIVATLHGWTGSLVVSRQSTFDKLLKRNELDKTGVYILYGPDTEDPLRMRAYIGEADIVKERIGTSAGNHAFWELAVAITTSDDALTKGHVRYLEARLWELAQTAGRVSLANSQQPSADRRRLPEADKANMEAFLSNLRTVLPVVGFDLLKPLPGVSNSQKILQAEPFTSTILSPEVPRFEIKHKTGITAYAMEQDGDFVVMTGSETRKDTGHLLGNYGELSADLIKRGVMTVGTTGDRYVFTQPWPFKSPSAAATIVLQRSANGRKEWKLEDRPDLSYHDWQSRK
ncbi:GIY-YIG nuclease family protein (plasmid) [Rhizobium sp. TH2]|uniref:GIY-YIG nuclease family protein n=1 Tax=Rhizobium sp. TH2 TaxID=2775403 RepID=UPI002158507C|nr:GIY-YIG nuclease family protein [Rhizobium sp. TH2]UVC12655.1 GIY-YIG nuclease family protein [Rhizobium sp. TH2]